MHIKPGVQKRALARIEISGCQSVLMPVAVTLFWHINQSMKPSLLQNGMSILCDCAGKRFDSFWCAGAVCILLIIGKRCLLLA
jgi:hypothetical protein